MLSPCRFSSSTSCTSFPLNTSRHLLFPESVPALAPVRGGGFFNRYYGDFCTGADRRFTCPAEQLLMLDLIYGTVTGLSGLSTACLLRSRETPARERGSK